MLKGKSREKYPPELRAFALTLSFYSSKAYCYLREKFGNSLPHPNTISRWYRSVDGSPGFTEQALSLMKIKVDEYHRLGHKVLCNLVMDEVAIMHRVEWTGTKFTGFVDIGTSIEGENLPEAKEALVFMLVSINDNWKVPVAYFLINGLTGQEKANVLLKLLHFIQETGIIVTSLTFDGAQSNMNMAQILGAKFDDVLHLKTCFINPASNMPIYIFLDPCHMLKLWRNCLAALGSLEDGEGRLIMWEFLTKLVQIQNDEGLHVATKLRNRHIKWENEKQKVKVAAQTFSNSVADALIYLADDLGLDTFNNCHATADFCRIANNIFDIFNTRTRFAKSKFKKALCPANSTEIFNYLEYCKQYILSLKSNGHSILLTRRKTGFLGFLICIESLQGIYLQYIANETPLLKYLLSYKFSQDHLELFFSAVRSHVGSNNNPTARQFESVYKRLLVHSEIKGSEKANAIYIDSTTILNVNSLTTSNLRENLEMSEHYIDMVSECQDHNYYSSQSWHLTVLTEDIVAYISGFVVKCLKKCVVCNECQNLLETDEPLSLLQRRKAYGKLINASMFVINICKTGESYLRCYMAQKNLFSKQGNIVQILITGTIRNLSSTVLQIINKHTCHNDPFNEHPLELVKLILKNYFNIRIHHETFKLKDNVQNRVRSLLTKAILFKNQ